MYEDACCICSKATSFALTQRVRPAFLGGKSIIITVSWCFTMQDFSRKTKNSSQKASKRKRTDTHNECLSFSRKEDCEYGYCCTTYTGNGVGIFGTIIILCRSQALSTPISRKNKKAVHPIKVNGRRCYLCKKTTDVIRSLGIYYAASFAAVLPLPLYPIFRLSASSSFL